MKTCRHVDLGVDPLERLAVLLEVQQLLLDAPEGSAPLACPSALPVLLQRVRHVLQVNGIMNHYKLMQPWRCSRHMFGYRL